MEYDYKATLCESDDEYDLNSFEYFGESLTISEE